MLNSNVNTNLMVTRHTVYMPVRLQDKAQSLNLIARIDAVWPKNKTKTQPPSDM